MSESKKLIFFGTDLAQIPCFRNTFLYAISTGIGTGLVHFMFTSKVKKSFHVGAFAYALTGIGYWTYCRYQYAMSKFALDQIPKQHFKKD